MENMVAENIACRMVVLNVRKAHGWQQYIAYQMTAADGTAIGSPVPARKLRG